MGKFSGHVFLSSVFWVCVLCSVFVFRDLFMDLFLLFLFLSFLDLDLDLGFFF